MIRTIRCSKFIVFAMIVCFISACKDTERQSYDSPPGYDFAHPYVIKLPFELDEVSGIVYNASDSSLFMQVDEKGSIYKLFPAHPTNILKWKIAAAQDFEDIVLLDSTFYLLSSTGNITSATILSKDSVDTREHVFPGDQVNEFEILYNDPYAKHLVLICKDCQDDKKKTTSGYAFDPVTETFFSSVFSIDVKQINKILGKKTGRFKPSAASINPLTGSLYIVSATDKLLVIAGRDGAIKGAYKLDPKLFKQPEGLTFTPTGTLIISNEAAEVGMANILVFKINETAKSNEK